MLRSRLQRTALVAAGATLAIVTALTLGRTPESTAPIEAPSQAIEPDDLSADLRRCAALDGTRIEDAGCMAVWEENRRRFFGGPALPHASATAPIRPLDVTEQPGRAGPSSGPEGAVR